jgi:DNA polymerase-3 subunit beta
MKLSTTTTALKHAVDLTARCADTGGAIPAMGCVKIATGGATTITGTSHDLICTAALAADVGEPGEACLPAHSLSQIAGVLPDGPVEIAADGRSATITAGSSTYQLSTPNAEDFPTPLDSQPDHGFTLDSGVFREALDRVLFAVPQRDPRRVLLGVLMEVTPERTSLTATDGTILGHRWFAPGADCTATTILPAKLLAEARRAATDGPVGIGLSERGIWIATDAANYYATKIDGQYPPYRTVIPTQHTVEIAVDADALIALLRRAEIVADELNTSVILTVDDGTIRARSRAYEVGAFAGQIDCTYHGDTFEIAFNARNLRACVEAVDAETVLIRATEPHRAITIHHPVQQNLLTLCMPVKISELSE